MKKSVILLVLTLFIQNAYAQDIIVKLSGEEITCLVKEINLQYIKYQHPDSTQGILNGIAKTDVFMIRFANGTKEVFDQNLPEDQLEVSSAKSPEQMYELGKSDAKRLYKGNGAMWGSAASTLVAFPFGIVGSAAIGLVKPKAHNNPVSDINYLSDPNYVKGYEDKAKKKKWGKVAAGAGIGVGTFSVVAVAVVASLLNSWH